MIQRSEKTLAVLIWHRAKRTNDISLGSKTFQKNAQMWYQAPFTPATATTCFAQT